MFPLRALVVAAAAAVVVAAPRGVTAGQERIATARSLRCVFAVVATSTWNKADPPAAAVKPSKLVLVFDSIDADEGTARLRSGTVGSEVTARRSGGYLHLIQSFRSGALYTTTVFDKDKTGDKLKAVHSRHEYFTVAVPGATSAPEQYYGECEARP